MSDMADLYDYENRDKKKNPFRSKPIPKGKIEWAINSTQSISSQLSSWVWHTIHLKSTQKNMTCLSKIKIK